MYGIELMRFIILITIPVMVIYVLIDIKFKKNKKENVFGFTQNKEDINRPHLYGNFLLGNKDIPLRTDTMLVIKEKTLDIYFRIDNNITEIAIKKENIININYTVTNRSKIVNKGGKSGTSGVTVNGNHLPAKEPELSYRSIKYIKAFDINIEFIENGENKKYIINTLYFPKNFIQQLFLN